MDAETLFDVGTTVIESQVVGPDEAPKGKSLVVVSPEWFAGRLKADYGRALEEIARRVECVEIAGQNDADVLIDMRAQAKDLAKRVEDLMKRHIAEPERTIKQIRATVRTYTTRIDELVKVIGDKLLAWQRLKLLREQELEKKKAEELRLLNERIAKEAEESGVEAPPPIEVPAAFRPETTQRTASGAKVTVVKRWTFDRESVDVLELARAVVAGQAPIGVITFDGAVIQKLIDGGTRELPGVRIYEKETIRG